MTGPTGNDHWEDLPSPRSPAELDSKILAYARDNAPEKAVFKPPFWLGGAATAAIIMVGLFITQTAPRQSEMDNLSSPAPTPARTLSPALMKSPTAKMEMTRREKSLDRDMAVEEVTTADSAAFSSIGVAAMDATPSPADIGSLINNCRDLIKSGPADEALKSCKELLDTCVDCELPEDLQADMETLEAAHRP